MIWDQELKSRLQEEITLRESNTILDIIKVLEFTFDSIEDDFSNIYYKSEKVVVSKIDNPNSVFVLSLNTLKNDGAHRVLYCTMENKGKDDPWINVAVVVPEIDNELVNIAGILVGKDKPLIQYLPAAKKYDISQEEEYYSYQTLKALIGNIFNYGY